MASTPAKKGPDHYRYYAVLNEGGVTVKCERFVVIGETECCYYVIRSSSAHLADTNWKTASAWQKKLRKRVLKASYGRRFCYPDRFKALASFRDRQRWRISHANRNLATAELALSVVVPVLEQGTEPQDTYSAGQNEYTRALNWSDC